MKFIVLDQNELLSCLIVLLGPWFWISRTSAVI